MQNHLSPLRLPKPDLWGGIECSINRVRNVYADQLRLSGHYDRPNDLEKIISTGITALRYPVLWEKTAPDSLNQPDWHWTDKQLLQLRQAGVLPIAGLLHHGCGPAYATFDHEDFPEQFARYAGMVARRYPWLTHYTPVNEPLTTARFSGLYGFWFPHYQSDEAFCKIFLRQCRGTVLAMQAIRKVQPAAQLVQTEDLGMTHSVPELAYQAEFENHRRWLTFDILCGKVTPTHPMWHYFRWAGIAEADLWFFVENPCPPGVLGINYYPTSERYLDTRLERYPPHLHGGNDRHAYVDTEAVRLPEVQMAGTANLLRHTWERYRIPVAITETHLGCTREEQLRWLYRTYEAALQLTREGVPVKAVTVWAMLGSYDWNTLLTRQSGHYEAGVWDVRFAETRPTALFHLTRKLTQQASNLPAVVHEKGWWERDSRPPKRHLLVLGSDAHLQALFEHHLHQRGIAFILLPGLPEEAEVRRVLSEKDIWAIADIALPEGEGYLFDETHFPPLGQPRRYGEKEVPFFSFAAFLTQYLAATEEMSLPETDRRTVARFHEIGAGSVLTAPVLELSDSAWHEAVRDGLEALIDVTS